jgi:pimeloyl-ACP methyl ester carboxylesterase
MAEAPDLPVRHFDGADGTQLAYRELGEGRPLVLLHGFISNATVNWVRYGHAATLAATGRRVVMPDLRGHGDSAAPHHADAYPPDVLADDGFALLGHLGLTEYDLGGYSLGARTTMRMLVRGATPGRAVVAGMGLGGILHPGASNEQFRRVLTHLGTFERGSPDWLVEAFLHTVGGDPTALLLVLGTAVDTPREALAGCSTPTLVVVGDDDPARDSARELAAVLAGASFAVVPGNHMSAVTKPELGATIARFV